jgi:hypothetical protein
MGPKVDYPSHVAAGPAEPVVNIGPTSPILTNRFLLAGSGAMQKVLALRRNSGRGLNNGHSEEWRSSG